LLPLRAGDIQFWTVVVLWQAMSRAEMATTIRTLKRHEYFLTARLAFHQETFSSL
jgi:hypothetical protein